VPLKRTAIIADFWKTATAGLVAGGRDGALRRPAPRAAAQLCVVVVHSIELDRRKNRMMLA
jgi:hypothetical protein